jgi:hypothetical protein
MVIRWEKESNCHSIGKTENAYWRRRVMAKKMIVIRWENVPQTCLPQAGVRKGKLRGCDVAKTSRSEEKKIVIRGERENRFLSRTSFEMNTLHGRRSG